MAQTGVHFLDEAEKEKLQKLVDEHSLSGAAKRLNVPRGTVAQALAGGVRLGTIEIIRDALKAASK